MGYQPYMRDLPDSDYVALQNANTERQLASAAKRITDILIASLALIFLLPAMIVIGLIIRITDRGPILFRHKRIGRNGKEFKCIKFRSMNVDAEAQLPRILSSCEKAREQWSANQKIDDDPRVTKIGKFLRKSSLDEIPQLLNVIKGDMSIVGPRPIVRSEVEKYGECFPLYSRVRPGLTGLWQVSGRSTTTYDDRVQLDVKYVTEWSYWGDIKIMVLTIPAVLTSNGAV